MNYKLFVLFSAVFVLASPIMPVKGDGDPDREEWIQLFNGRDLDDWVVKITGYELGENFGDTFRVEDGLLKVSYDQYTEFGMRFGYIFHRRKFSHYRLVVEYRFVGEQVAGAPDWGYRNSGIMLHSQPPESMRRDQNFPVSVEVQLLGGPGEGERPTANLFTAGTRVVMDGRLVPEPLVSSSAKTYHGDQWVRVEALVLGNSTIRHIIDDEVVLFFEMPQIGRDNVRPVNPWIMRDGELLSEGYIGLQAESHPIEFRKIELLNLAGCMDPEAKNYKSYFLKAENWRCQY